MWRKIIDDYRLQYLNDLFEIKLIFFTIRVVYNNVLNLGGCYVIQHKSVLAIFSL